LDSSAHFAPVAVAQIVAAGSFRLVLGLLVVLRRLHWVRWLTKLASKARM
jgi:hypothetical protein